MFHLVLMGATAAWAGRLAPERLPVEPLPAWAATTEAPEPVVLRGGFFGSRRGTGTVVVGSTVAVVGALDVLASWYAFDVARFAGMTPGEFRMLQVVNTIGWVGFFAGTGTTAVGLVQLGKSGRGLALQGTFR